LLRPYVDTTLPHRLLSRSDRHEPRCTKSSTDSDEPNRATPYIETVDPNLEKDLRDTTDPICMKSQIDIAELKRDIP
jgi:hypothetical protein